MWQVKCPAFQKDLDNIPHHFLCSHRGPPGPPTCLLLPRARGREKWSCQCTGHSELPERGAGVQTQKVDLSSGSYKGLAQATEPKPLAARWEMRPGVLTVEDAAPFCEGQVPWHWQVFTSIQAGVPPCPQTLFLIPYGLDAGFPASKAPMRSMVGRLLSEDSEPTRNRPAEYPPFFSTAGEELEKRAWVQRSDRPGPHPHPQRPGEDLSERARQDCMCRPGTEKAQRHPGWEGVVCPLSWMTTGVTEGGTGSWHRVGSPGWAQRQCGIERRALDPESGVSGLILLPALTQF